MIPRERQRSGNSWTLLHANLETGLGTHYDSLPIVGQSDEVKKELKATKPNIKWQSRNGE